MHTQVNYAGYLKEERDGERHKKGVTGHKTGDVIGWAALVE